MTHLPTLLHTYTCRLAATSRARKRARLIERPPCCRHIILPPGHQHGLCPACLSPSLHHPPPPATRQQLCVLVSLCPACLLPTNACRHHRPLSPHPLSPLPSPPAVSPSHRHRPPSWSPTRLLSLAPVNRNKLNTRTCSTCCLPLSATPVCHHHSSSPSPCDKMSTCSCLSRCARSCSHPCSSCFPKLNNKNYVKYPAALVSRHC